jgi:hypothetical protein
MCTFLDRAPYTLQSVIPRGTATRAAGSATVAAEAASGVSYAGKSSGTQGPVGARAEEGPRQPSPGKQTLVEQVFAPAVQQRAGDQHHRNDETTVHAAASRGVATPSSPLPFSDTIQRAFGRHDVSAIQAHTGPDAAASAQAMGADAYATADHVVLGRGADLHTVAHEAAHVVQQRGGVQLKGGVGAAGDTYERHADAVADRVVAGQSAEDLLDQVPSAARPEPRRRSSARRARTTPRSSSIKPASREPTSRFPHSKARCWPPGRMRSSSACCRKRRSTPVWRYHRR